MSARKASSGGSVRSICRETLFAATDTPGGSETPCVALLDLRLPLSLGRQLADGGVFWRAGQTDECLRGCPSRLDAERAISLLTDPHFVAGSQAKPATNSAGRTKRPRASNRAVPRMRPMWENDSASHQGTDVGRTWPTRRLADSTGLPLPATAARAHKGHEATPEPRKSPGFSRTLDHAPGEIRTPDLRFRS